MATKQAVVFPGQGSQSVGMLNELAAAYPEINNTFEQASSALEYDLWELVSEGPAEMLDNTQRAQPAILTASVAMWRVWHAQGATPPALLAGHSLGEYSALVCADSMAFTDAVKLVAERGRLMQEAVPAGMGAMAAVIGLSDEEVVAVCDEASRVDKEGAVSAANFNSPGQVVIAGHREAVERAAGLAKEAGARMVKILPVSVPSHCDLMKPAAAQFAETLQQVTIRPPQIPVINNVDVAMASDPDVIRDALVRQLYSPVRWVETVQRMVEAGVSAVYECGPGKVLTGLNKRIAADLNYHALSNVEAFAASLQTSEAV